MSKKEITKKLLSDMPSDKAFHFHVDVELYTGKYASNLKSFCDALNDVDTRSVEFHLSRKDFENWIKFLGDKILVMQIAKLRKKRLTGEKLRRELHGIVERRINSLKRSL
ncbi:MAG: DUF5752 family protein [Candidatus Bathyarchaeota archaeon]